MNPLRIMLVRSDVRIAGPAKVMHVYAQEMRKRGHEVIFVSGGGSYLPILEADGFRHELITELQFHTRDLFSAPRIVFALARIIRNERINVINSFNAHAGLLAALADPFRRARHFNTVNGTGKEWVNRFLPGSIISVSDHVRRRLIDARVPKAKIKTVYNSVLEDRFFAPIPPRPQGDGTDAPVLFVSVAMFTGQKGHERIIPLIASLADQGLRVELTMVGDGPSRPACEAMAAEMGIAGRVTFAGALTDVIPALDTADIFIHLPEFETFGIVLAEAMARSLPVISLRIGGIPEVVHDGVTGLLFDPDDKVGIENSASALVRNPEERQNLASQGRERASALFRRSRLADAVEKLYRGDLS